MLLLVTDWVDKSSIFGPWVIGAHELLVNDGTYFLKTFSTVSEWVESKKLIIFRVSSKKVEFFF